MKGRYLKATLVIAGLVTMVAAGFGVSKSGAQSWTGDPVADRQRFMKLNGALWKDVQDKAKAGNIEGIVVDAEALAVNATRVVSLFPQGSQSDKSAAKPEVWQKWGDFEMAAKNFQMESEKLRDIAKTKDADATNAAIKDFGRKACGSCHQPFRVPPKQN